MTGIPEDSIDFPANDLNGARAVEILRYTMEEFRLRAEADASPDLRAKFSRQAAAIESALRRINMSPSAADGPMAPDEGTVHAAIEEYRWIGEEAFLDKYADGHRPRKHYLVYDGERFPMKAIWAAAHRPTINTSHFKAVRARTGLGRLGFEVV